MSEIAVPEPNDAIVSLRDHYPNLALIAGRLQIEAITDDENMDTASLSIMEAIASATTVEELFQAADAGTTSGKDYTLRPFLLRSEDIQWRASAYNETGFPFYALLQVVDVETGEKRAISCGGQSVVVTLASLQKLNAFDQFPDGRPLQFVAKTTASGYEVLKLMPATIGKTNNNGKDKS